MRKSCVIPILSAHTAKHQFHLPISRLPTPDSRLPTPDSRLPTSKNLYQ
ncbi:MULTISPECIES: hypothetical protein [unclassified Moorena]|nr:MULTISPECIES: hypothetical protein [unclassified Moorena]NEO05942.1 hypothetical protein [Moorena sp. SIO3I8]